MENNELTWEPYILIKGTEIPEFWDSILSKQKSTLYIIAKGFDPRMNSFVQELKNNLTKRVSFAVLNIEGQGGPFIRNSNDNWTQFQNILDQSEADYKIYDLPMWENKQNSKIRVGPNKASNFANKELLQNFDNIVVDIGSMPKAIYFSLITGILDYSREKNKNGTLVNVLINVSENTALDLSITNSGIDEKADFIPGLGGDFGLQSDPSILDGYSKAKIWMPILGEKQEHKIKRIYEEIVPNEICPVIPFPSMTPRRTDDLLLEYRAILFDNWTIEYGNLLYASESNPFELYRHLMKTCMRYAKALKPIGGCKIAISSLSSKLISIGALLASYELYRIKGQSVGLIHVGGSQYAFNENYEEKFSLDSQNLITLWVDGEPYA